MAGRRFGFGPLSRFGKWGLFYLVFGAAWILFTDRIILLLASDVQQLAFLQTLKGLAFVAISIVIMSAALVSELRGRRQAEDALASREATLHQVTEEITDPLMAVTDDGTVAWCSTVAAEALNCKPADLDGRSFFALTHPADLSDLLEMLQNARAGKDAACILRLRLPGGRYAPFACRFRPARGTAGEGRLIVTLVHASTRRDSEPRDEMTGLFTRAAFESRIRALEPEAAADGGCVLVADIDGLRRINVEMGDETGDMVVRAVAQALSDAVPADAASARLGDGQFACLLPETADGPETLARSIERAVTGKIPEQVRARFHLSMGWASVRETGGSLARALEVAEERMQREKLLSHESSRASVVSALRQALAARDFLTDGHAERLEGMILKLGRAAGLPAHRLTDLRLFAWFHDLGKLGVPDHILFKPGPLTPEEWAEMRKHTTIGCEIARTVPELERVADWILKHHERWDGKGYPLGLKGTEIPLECRLLAIVDSFDALTSARPYRQPLPAAEAVREIVRCAGTQFDPDLVRLFVGIIGQQGDQARHSAGAEPRPPS